MMERSTGRVVLSAGWRETGQDRRAQAIFMVSAVMLVAGLLLGGASRLDPLGHMAVQLAGLALLGPAMLRTDLARADQALPMAILGAMALLPLLQLAPLPPGVWTELPGHAPLAQAVSLAGLPEHWRPMTLSPADTQRALLSLIAPAALFLAVAPMGGRQRASLAMLVVGAGILGLLVAAIQAAGGEAGYLRWRPLAPIGQPLGFFVNRNHQAIFLLSAAVLAAALARTEPTPGRPVFRPTVALILMALLIVGALATLSRAGVLLAGPALAGGFLVLRSPRRGDAFGGPTLAWSAALTAMATLIAMIVLAKGGLILDRFENGQGGGRLQILPQVLDLARLHQPLGAGFGSFDLVYRASERLEDIDPFYLNHAHNDFAELWLEAGWPGLALIVAFVAWWGLAVRQHWFGSLYDPLGRAGTIVIGLLLSHSLVDYPLRTPAMALVMALACALATRLAPTRAVTCAA